MKHHNPKHQRLPSPIYCQCFLPTQLACWQLQPDEETVNTWDVLLFANIVQSMHSSAAKCYKLGYYQFFSSAASQQSWRNVRHQYMKVGAILINQLSLPEAEFPWAMTYQKCPWGGKHGDISTEPVFLLEWQVIPHWFWNPSCWSSTVQIS